MRGGPRGRQPHARRRQAARRRARARRRAATSASASSCPQSDPSAGLVIYDEAVRESAQVRVDLALSRAQRRGHRGDRRSRRRRPVPRRRWTPSPSAGPTRSSSPPTPPLSSGWLRRDLIERIRNASGLPVEHVVVDLEQRGAAVQGHAGGRQQDLERRRADRAPQARRPRTASASCSSRSCRSPTAAARRRARRARAWRRCSTACTAPGCSSSGMIGDPDPYTAAINALELFRVDDVVISTLPDERSGWLRSNLIERVQQREPPRRSSTSSSTSRPPRPRRSAA